MKKNMKSNEDIMREARQLGRIRIIRHFELRNSNDRMERELFPIPSATEEYIKDFRDEKGNLDDNIIKKRMTDIIYKELSSDKLDLFKPNDVCNTYLLYGEYGPCAAIYPNNPIMNNVVLTLNSFLQLLSCETHIYRRGELFVCSVLSLYYAEILIEVYKKLNYKLVNVREEDK